MPELPLQNYLTPLWQNLVIFIPKLIAAVVIFLATLLLASLVARAVKRATKARNVDPELAILFTRLARWGVIIMGSVWALETVDRNITGFIAGLGIAGFTIGFALQDIAKNFVAGMLLLLQQPFDTGDAIEIIGYGGVVQEVSLRATEIITFDGLHVTIPNSDVYTNPLTNYSRARQRRLALKVGVAYNSDLNRVSDIAIQAVKEVPGSLTDEKAPTIVFDNFGASSVDFTLYVWIDTGVTSYLEATDAGVKLIKAAFEREQIEIPYPVTTLLTGQQVN